MTQTVELPSEILHLRVLTKRLLNQKTSILTTFRSSNAINRVQKKEVVATLEALSEEAEEVSPLLNLSFLTTVI